MSIENSKPEWFHMAENDAFEPKPKSKRIMRIMALTTPLLVLGAGLVFAQTQDSSPAVASAGTSAVSTVATTDPISLTSTPTTQKASITIKKPGITKPTGGGEDDGLERSDD